MGTASILRKTAFAAGCAAFSLAAQANLLQNGSFEDINGAVLRGWGGYTYGTGFSAMAGWTVGTGSVDIVVDTSPWTPPQSGFNALDLNGDSMGAISQTFATVAGGNYTLSFWYSKNAIAGGSSDPSMATYSLDGGTTNFNITATNAANVSGVLNRWTPVSVAFVATGASTTLSFTSTTAGSGGVFLDSISVVPEPEGYALALAAVAVLGAASKRKRQV
jgi:choice-of-anchor C domain-containing protein